MSRKSQPILAKSTDSRLKRQAAGHFNSLSMNPSVLPGQKSSDHRSEVIRHSGTPQCSHGRDLLVHFGTVPHHAAIAGLNRAWRDDVGADGSSQLHLSLISASGPK
jgi:hypothetical protein